MGMQSLEHELLQQVKSYEQQVFRNPIQCPFEICPRCHLSDPKFKVHEIISRERVLFTKLFLKQRSRQVDHFLSVSSFTKTEMIELLQVPERQITVTPLATDPIFFPRDTNQVVRLLEKKGWPRAYFLFIGRGDPRKNQELVVRTARSPECPLPLLSVGWSG